MILLPFYVDDIIKTALTEDINYIDSTADLLIPEDSISSAYFMSKADGVLCGLEVALRVFTILDPEMKIECRFKDGDKVKITVGPKGFGSENMSQIRMFKPSAGLQGIKDFILEVVETAGPNPCPPMVVGVGIGGTFDKAALLAKKALMRPLDSENPDPFYADLEKEMLEKVNQLGIGPQGFGGKTTAIGLNIETMPTHIAGMPCAVNINCHVTRHKTEVL